MSVKTTLLSCEPPIIDAGQRLLSRDSRLFKQCCRSLWCDTYCNGKYITLMWDELQ